MADEVQIKDAKAYPEWKVIAWRFLRTAIAGGSGSIIAATITLKPDLSNIKEYGFALTAAFIAGAIGAIGLLARDLWGNSTKTGIADKIII